MSHAYNLNPAQKHAIECMRGPIIIKAGPGTGKTKTLIARIEHLITSQNVFPAHILALTFSRKAAAEMQERLSHLKEKPIVTTFHGLAFDLLKKINGSTDIISDHDRNEIIQMIVEKQKEKTLTKKDLRDIILAISTYKNSLSSKKSPIQPIIDLYNKQLAERNMIDYDDLLLKLYQELQTNNDDIRSVLESYSHVLIDEFQDTNKLQYELIMLFAKPENLFVIGDPYQSIYSFRGADSTIFETIANDFPYCVKISLTDNYRSTQDIIDCSSLLFSDTSLLHAISTEPGSTHLVKTWNEYTEAHYILDRINKKVGGTDLLKTEGVEEGSCVRFSDIAVIYRTHHIGRQLETVFIESGIPFQVIGGNSPYEKPSMQFITNVLRYSVSQSDEVLKHIVYSPIVHISSKTLRTIRTIQQEQKIEYGLAVPAVIAQTLVDKKECQKLSTLLHFLNNIVEKARTSKLTEIIHNICPQWSIELDIHLQQYVSCALQYENRSLSTFVDYLDYLEQHEFYDESADKVTLLTMHAAKGLEFNQVFICGFEDGLIPFIKNENEDISEEKRLLYVAMTRAKRDLVLTYASERGKKAQVCSRFYHEISKKNILQEHEDYAIAKMQRKVEKWKEKKSQLSLF